MQPTTSCRNYFENILPDQVKSNQAYKDLRYHKWKTAEKKIDDRTDVAGIQIRFLNNVPYYVLGFSGDSDSKESAGNAGDTGSLGGEDPLEKGMAIHPSILAWRIQWTEEPGGLQSTGSQRIGHDWHFPLFTIFRR